MAKIDARGKSCPQPVMMTKTYVDSGEKELEIFLDNAVSASNVQRYLEKNGFRVQIIDEDGTITIRGSKNSWTTGAARATEDQEKALQNTAVLIADRIIGGGDQVLGEVLMKGFLGTLSQLANPPSVVALMNEGVKLALKNTSSCDHLSALRKKGTRILVCGTCTNHFGITADIGAGVISNMFEITEALLSAEKQLTV